VNETEGKMALGRLRLGSGKVPSPNDLHPLFRFFLTEQVDRINLALVKTFRADFYSKSDMDAEWKLEYRRQLSKSEMEKFNVQRMLQTLKDSWHAFQEQTFCRVCMFLVDGIMYGSPSLNYDRKEIHGTLINKDLYQYLGPSRATGDVATFDLMDLYSGDETRIFFYEPRDLVIVGRFLYMGGEIVGELDDEQFEAVLEDGYDFCEQTPEMAAKFGARNVYHEGEACKVG